MDVKIPKVQTVALIEDAGPNGRIVIRNDYPITQPGDGEVLVKIECSGICYSDVMVLMGGVPDYQEIPCHEGVGCVVQLGANVTPDLLGQRVGIKWIYSVCGNCYNCNLGRENWCINQVNTGTNRPGTLQQYAVGNADYLTLIPDGLSSEDAAPFLCAGITMAGAMPLCEDALMDGSYLVISGSGGGLGHLGLQIATKMKKQKNLKIIGIDSGDAKRRLSLGLGADAFVDFETDDVVKRVRELTGGKGAHVAIVTPAVTEAYDHAVEYLRHTGVLICEGITSDDYRLPISPTGMEYKGLIVKGGHVGTERQMVEMLNAAVRKELVPKIEVHDFLATPALFKRLQTGQVVGRLVVKMPQ